MNRRSPEARTAEPWQGLPFRPFLVLEYEPGADGGGFYGLAEGGISLVAGKAGAASSRQGTS